MSPGLEDFLIRCFHDPGISLHRKPKPQRAHNDESLTLTQPEMALETCLMRKPLVELLSKMPGNTRKRPRINETHTSPRHTTLLTPEDYGTFMWVGWHKRHMCGWFKPQVFPKYSLASRIKHWGISLVWHLGTTGQLHRLQAAAQLMSRVHSKQTPVCRSFSLYFAAFLRSLSPSVDYHMSFCPLRLPWNMLE